MCAPSASKTICSQRRKFRTTAVRVSSLALITAAEISCCSSSIVCGLFFKLYHSKIPIRNNRIGSDLERMVARITHMRTVQENNIIEANQSLLMRAQKCIESEGGHFEQLL
jgi:hypothetical protein